MKQTALVFATDEAFAPLAKGLVLSVREAAQAPDEFALYMIDIGCSDATRRWMAEHSVTRRSFEPDDFFTAALKTPLQRYHLAQLCRPFLPRLFPGHETYIWSDSDIWFQDIATLRLYRDIAAQQQDSVPISPLIDVSYGYLYEDATEFLTYARLWYGDTYGPTLDPSYLNKSTFSSGLFAMSRDNSIWERWAEEIQRIFSQEIPNHFSVHLAEQTALNYILHSTKRFIPMEAIHNYNCHIGCAQRRADGRVVVSDPPERAIGAIHLTYSSKMMGEYIDHKLLYSAGSYLDAAELEGLRRLSHY